MENLRETIMEHIKNEQSLNPTQISILQDRLSHIVSQFHTPDHPPYAAMIHRAIQELKQKGGTTEKSISEFIRREYDDLPWAHCSLLKHHLGLLSEHGEITVSRGCRYSVCGAGSSKGSIKGGKKHRRKCRWKFERKRTKRLKLAIKLNDQTPKQDGTIGKVLLQSSDKGEDDICSGSKAMDIDPPLLTLTDDRENQVGIDEKQRENCHLKLHNTSGLHAMEPPAWNPNEDAIHEHSSPERPPGFEFMGVEVSALPSEKEEQQRKTLPRPVAEELKNPDLPCPLQSIQEKKQEKKKGGHVEGRRLKIMFGHKEVVLALPRLQKESPIKNDSSQRQLRRWTGDLPDISHTVKASSSSENSGKCPPVEITSDVEKSQVMKKPPTKFTIITRRNAKVSSIQRLSGARPQPVSVSVCPSMDSQQDEGSDSLGVCHSTQMLESPRKDKDIPLKKYQRRSRRPSDKIAQDELPLVEILKQQAKKLPKSLRYHIPRENTSEATLTTELESSEKDNQLGVSKPRLRGRPPTRNLGVKKGKDEQSTTNKLKKFSHHRARKIQKKF